MNKFKQINAYVIIVINELIFVIAIWLKHHILYKKTITSSEPNTTWGPAMLFDIFW